jgi:N-acetylglucosaminyldiphosphoundecaprenol N-acetyl-beta-D-mannosaminyltransferase
MAKLGVGLVEGLKVLSGGYKNKIITGVDLIDKLCEVAAKNKREVFFLGGWGDRGERTAIYFQQKYPLLKVAGTYAGSRDGEDEKILSILNKQKIDYLFVAFAMKSQEEWINRNLEKLKCKVVIGLGRTFDYYSGELPRAPKWMQNIGLEWLFSLLTDKGRRKRKLALPKFIWKVLTN